jgi:hypothetical protein
VSWKWTRLRAVLVSLDVVRSSEDGVKLLTGGHAAVIFGECRGSECQVRTQNHTREVDTHTRRGRTDGESEPRHR